MKTIIIHYIIRRLTEASTLKGIILSVASAMGLALSGQQTDSAVWIVLGIVGIIGSLFPDKFSMPMRKNIPSVEESIQQNENDNEFSIPTPPYNDTQPTTESGWGDK
jgi:hypothetical protein